MGMVSVVLGSSYLARWEERYEGALRLAGTARVPPRPRLVLGPAQRGRQGAVVVVVA
jgi:hypothetical protein